MPAWNPRANEVFVNAVELVSPDERRAYLESACGADEMLRQQVEKLLKAHGDAGSFLERQPEAIEPTVVPAKTPADGAIGSSIGPYKLLQVIGEGGMGTVFMAEQTTPVKRMVALKIIKAGMETGQVVARFEAERQALALMDHPHIAKVLDAGTTETGRPYFVMELVKGVPITNYCDEHRLPLHERLELIVPVCQAIQHAHQKGIIHRDLKPSNVLIASYDGRPVPKVIDFGVAKALGKQLTERTMFTGFGGLVGTLEYMSPEQAEFNALDVDTRSDIYSLGVLLYELLTGSTPLTKQQMKQAALTEVLRLIREEEPPKPSTRLTQSRDSLPSVSAQRRLDVVKLTKAVAGELDWIVMKALEKDRTRRYESANGLARDIERYLQDEPVEACPPSVGYRLRKMARRYKVALTTTLLVTLALVLGTAVSTWQAVRATGAESAARAAEDDATSERDRARDAAEEARAAGNNAQRDRDAAVAAEQRAEEAAEKARIAEGQAKGERDQAQKALLAMFNLSVYFQSGGKNEPAMAVYLKALELSRRAGELGHPEIPPVVFVGVVEFKRQEKYDEAQRLLEQIVALYEEWHEPVQAFAYRQDLEAVRKLVKSGPADIVDVGNFPVKTFVTTIGIDHWMIRFDAKQSFTISFNNDRVVEGTYKVVKNELELTDEMGLAANKGNRKTGTYRWKLAERRLTLMRIKDEADARAGILTSGSWEMTE